MKNKHFFEISTGIGCKNNCSYCPQSVITKAYKSKIKLMPLSTFKRCLNKVPKENVVMFTGLSEPFLNPECINMIKYAFTSGFKVQVFTTCVGITQEILREIIKLEILYGYDYFQVHLPDAENKTSIKVNNELVDTIQIIKEANIKNINFQLFGKLHPKVKERLGNDFNPEDVSRLLQNRAGNLKENFSVPVKTLRGNIICRTQIKDLRNILLLPNGDISLCCMDYSLSYVFGNLLKQTYKELFKSKKYKEYIEALSDDTKRVLCRNCAYGVEMNNSIDLIKVKFNDSKIKKKIYEVVKKIK